MVSRQLLEILSPRRTDGALQNGDMITGDGNAVPCREPIERPRTLGRSDAPAQIGTGDMVSGSEFAEQPLLGIIEKVADSRSQLPVRLGGEP